MGLVAGQAGRTRPKARAVGVRPGRGPPAVGPWARPAPSELAPVAVAGRAGRLGAYPEFGRARFTGEARAVVARAGPVRAVTGKTTTLRGVQRTAA